MTQHVPSPDASTAHAPGCLAAVDRPPRITIITVCQNDEQGIEQCLSSVASQTVTDIEHVVVYRQSQDQTLPKLLRHQDRLTIVFAAANESLPQALNRGIKQAGGEIIGFLGPHDRFAHPGVLEGVCDAMANPWTSALYGDLQHPSPRGEFAAGKVHRFGSFTRKRLGWGWSPALSVLFVRRHWLRRIGGFSLSMPEAADYDAVLRLFSQPFFKAVYLQQPLVTRVRAPWSLERLRAQWRRPRQELQALRQAHLGGLGALGLRYLAKFRLALSRA